MPEIQQNRKRQSSKRELAKLYDHIINKGSCYRSKGLDVALHNKDLVYKLFFVSLLFMNFYSNIYLYLINQFKNA